MTTIMTSCAQWRADLLRSVERWTYKRKIKLCEGLYAKVVSAGEVISAHGLDRDEIDRWMEAYGNKDFSALKATYQKTRAGAMKRVPDSLAVHHAICE